MPTEKQLLVTFVEQNAEIIERLARIEKAQAAAAAVPEGALLFDPVPPPPPAEKDA